MAKFKCSDGIYTVLRNGKVVAGGATAGEAIVAISTDAGEVACCSIEITGMEFTGESFDFLVSADGSNLNLCYDFNSGAVTGCVGCLPNSTTISAGSLVQYFANPLGIELTFYVSNDNCLTYCDSVVINNHVRVTTVPTGGGATVIPVPAGSPACAGTTLYVEAYALGIVGATLNTSTGALTVPAQVVAGFGVFYYYKLCDGLLTGILAIVVSNP